MKTDPEQLPQQMIRLLDKTRLDTCAILSNLDPDRVIHSDAQAWRVRDILGHLGVWNMEAARALQSYADGGEYCCIFNEMEYDDYNDTAADERKSWTIEQIWAEYNSSHDELKQILASLPDEKWNGEMLFPWNSKGTVEHLIRLMMCHETGNHCALVVKATL